MSYHPCRILVQHMPKYKDQVKLVDWHIKSEHSAEMAEASEVVCSFVLSNLHYIYILQLSNLHYIYTTGVTLKNEANLGDMCHILNDLSKYVSSAVSNDPEGGSRVRIVQLLFFGDQLTLERARGAMVLRFLHENAINRLKGFVPAIANWHARMTLVKVWNFFCYNVCIMHVYTGDLE